MLPMSLTARKHKMSDFQIAGNGQQQGPLAGNGQQQGRHIDMPGYFFNGPTRFVVGIKEPPFNIFEEAGEQRLASIAYSTARANSPSIPLQSARMLPLEFLPRVTSRQRRAST
jgi:hypothetical protein